MTDPAAGPLSLTGRRWRLRTPDADDRALAALSRKTRLPGVAARCLAHRASPADASSWLSPSREHLHDPYAMLGMASAIERVRRAIAERERIRIVTDYDVDGTTSSLILQNALLLAGAERGQIDYHIPDRFGEGYGFSQIAARKAGDDGIGLVITADIGVRDHAAVTLAAAAGVDVIICDHHLPGGASVPADARVVLCPPQDGCDYPNPSLAACGVSLKLAQALLSDHPKYDLLLASMLKVAAIGTVADIVDLGTPENRAIVALGLEALRTGRHSPGLQALLDISRVDRATLTASDLGFRIGPRVNAAGRLESATAVIELFGERDPGRARELARNLDRLNHRRRAIQEQLVKQCVAQLTTPAPSFVVCWGPEEEGWHRGVVGIVAARIRDRVHRPVAVVSVSGDEARGSVRSTPAVHAVRALDGVQDLLIQYGGHPVAAGFSIAAADLLALSSRLPLWVERNHDTTVHVPELKLEAACPPGAVDRNLVVSLQRLGPFGKGNPAPLLRIDGVRPSALRRRGDSQQHLFFRANGVEAVWWQGATHAADLERPVDLAVQAEMNNWQGRSSVRMTVEDARPAHLP